MGGESVCVRICVFCVWGLALLIFVFVGEVGVLFCFITACKRTFSKKKKKKRGRFLLFVSSGFSSTFFSFLFASLNDSGVLGWMGSSGETGWFDSCLCELLPLGSVEGWVHCFSNSPPRPNYFAG